MKYVIRLLATLPMIGAGVATIVFFVMAFGENNIWILTSISSAFSFAVCAEHYEETVISVRDFIKIICDSTLTCK